MTESDTITCPECESDQPSTAPFCQNCGYRMRSPKTLREPMVAIPEDDGTDEDGDSTSSSESADSSPGGGSRRPSRQMVPTESSSSDTGLDEGTIPEPNPDATGFKKSPDTLVEGMRAIPRDEPDSPEADADDSAEDIESSAAASDTPDSRSDRRTSRLPVDRQRANIRWIVVGTLLACVAIIGGLSWLHLHRQATAEDPETQMTEPEIVTIEAGPFQRGLNEEAEAFILEFCYRYYDDPEEECDRERLLTGEYPEQTVRMPEYGIDSTPVRNVDYRRCVDAGDCEPIDYENCDVWTPQGLQVGARVPRVLRRDNRPVVCVDRPRAADYCEWTDGELPTHNQWEKAARADETPLFPWGDRWEPDRANWGEQDVMRISVPGALDGHAWTSPPGAFPEGRSPYGLEDMAGNVSEWVRGEDPLQGHVRGGSWVSTPFELRTTARHDLDVDASRTDVGFRCAY